MKHNSINESVVNDIVSQAYWGTAGIKVKAPSKVEESTEVEATEEVDTPQEEIVEAESHECPLCCSKLDEELSDDVIAEHISDILEIATSVSQLTEEDIDGEEDSED